MAVSGGLEDLSEVGWECQWLVQAQGLKKLSALFLLPSPFPNPPHHYTDHSEPLIDFMHYAIHLTMSYELFYEKKKIFFLLLLLSPGYE
jgi:hypothetical protein